MKRSNLRVVIMGASSGIGAATAIAFAREGADLVLGARGKEGLDDVARRCFQAGGRAETVVVDATDAKAVAAFAREARSILGQIDLWFSNVGAGVVGKYQDVPMDDHRQVIETNLLTHMNDAHAVLPIFLEQDRGIWVNMISSGGYVATPYAAAYAASKFGLRGFSEALRAEVGKRRRVHVCDVYPTFVDSPGFSHAANYSGAHLSYPPGALAPETVADAVVRLARRPRDTTVIGAPAAAMKATQLAPNLVAAGMNRFMDAWAKRAQRAPDTRGALYEAPRGASGLHADPSRLNQPRPQPSQPASKALVAGAAVVAAAIGMQLLRKRADQ
jgi:short-subunit dehydrogenase